jgi:hypothetical protein
VSIELEKEAVHIPQSRRKSSRKSEGSETEAQQQEESQPEESQQEESQQEESQPEESQPEESEESQSEEAPQAEEQKQEDEAQEEPQEEEAQGDIPGKFQEQAPLPDPAKRYEATSEVLDRYREEDVRDHNARAGGGEVHEGELQRQRENHLRRTAGEPPLEEEQSSEETGDESEAEEKV